MSNNVTGNINISLSQCLQLADEIKQGLLSLANSAINNNSPAQNYDLDDKYVALITSSFSSADLQDMVSPFFRRHQHSASTSKEQSAIDMVLQTSELQAAASSHLAAMFEPQIIDLLKERKFDACKELIAKLPACPARMKMVGRIADEEFKSPC
jgi:hypothetical protein